MDKTYLVEVEHQIQLTDVPEELVQHLHKEMYGLQIRQRIIVRIHTCTEEKPCVTPVNDLARSPELREVALMFLVPWCDKTVHLAFQLDLLVIVVGAVPLR